MARNELDYYDICNNREEALDVIRAMHVFTKVVETNSLVAAADQLNTSNAAVSRQIATLEQHLGTRLLNRTTRRISLTDAGQEFLGRAQQILSDLAEAEAIAGENAATPTGVLRISAPLSFGISTFSRWLPGFIAKYPKLRLHIDLSDQLTDLATDGIDVAVRIGRQPAYTNVISKRLSAITTEICAAPDYLARHGTPQSPAELASHETLSYSYLASGDTWTLTNANGHQEVVRIKPCVHATNGDILRELAIAGRGIIMQPSFIVENDIASGKLVRLLPDWSLEGFNLYAVYLSRKFLPAKVRVFIDHLTQSAATTDHPDVSA